ncbi:MAG TPA: sensor histidine kinase [Pilimelia sp.]|nr:sensor histidine kinase [Pilimelia sp.]
MLTTWVIVAVAAAYLGLLFGIARYADRRADAGRSLVSSGWVYALSLAVYATSWTYYGSVGRAASTGVGFLPIYLGPTLTFAVGWLVIRKIIRVSRQRRITSLADFASARYGNSALLGALVTLVAVVGTVPYIALQLKAVSNTFSILRRYPEITSPAQLGQPPVVQDTGLYVALLLALFAILFGTRHLDASERHEGMVAAVAFESIVKLVAFLTVGVFITFAMFGGLGDLFSQAAATPATEALFTLAPETSYSTWLWLIVLSMLAVLLLPRQWQVTVVENVDERHVARASWLFPLYLLVINLFVLPIALAGLLHFGDGSVDPDTFVLALPMADGQPWLALIVFIGGLSASTAMIIVETVALATMVSNSLILPGLLRRGGKYLGPRGVGRLALTVRRVTIVAVVLLGYAYFRFAGEASLVSIGLVSFAAVAQFAPAILGGLYWRGGSRGGALAGLVGGFLVWLHTLVVPDLARAGYLSLDVLERGPWGIGLLRPESLLGLAGLDRISHAMLWSMIVNVGLYVGVSLAGRRSPAEHAQAAAFVDVLRQPADAAGARLWRGSARVADLRGLLARYLGPDGAHDALSRYLSDRGLQRLPEDGETADDELVHHVETVLAGALGIASARVLVASVVHEEPLGVGEVIQILDETSQVRAYSRELERKSAELEAATAELRAANDRLRELDRMKDDFVSTVTHELRTPLTSIRAFSEILLDNPDLDTAARQRYLEIVVAETARLTRLINQVLDLAKIESGTAEWRIGEVDLAALVRDAAAEAAQLFTGKGARLDVRVPPTVPPVAADTDRVMQVLLNLLANAATYCDPRQGEALVEVQVDDGAARVDVHDNGPGIAADEQAVIFERFRQGDRAAGSRPAGTGLGLPISREIVERMGGRLWVSSAPGQGATFSFTLPLSGERAES